MAENKRKRSSPVVESPPPLLSKGFSSRDERLPASPPLAESSRHGLMSLLRDRYRDAVDKLFGATPIVLNELCAARAARAACSVARRRPANPDHLPPDLDHRQHHYDDDDDDDGDERDDVLAHRSKRSRRSSHAAVPSDQVVPEISEVARPALAASAAAVASPACKEGACVCANSMWSAEGVGSDVMLRTAEELSERIIVLYGRAFDAATNQVDYASLVHSSDFHDYLASARKLRYFDPLLLDRSGRKAFFLNVYNSLMIHAITVMSKPRSMFERISMYNTAAYNIGGRPYSLNMIEHGVLRSNRCGNGPFAQPSFAPSDARRLCALPTVDPRIHFALNCGAMSCPPVRFYDARNLDQALDSATRSYLHDLLVDVETRTITLPKLLHWYQADFCENGMVDAVIEWTLPYLCAEKKRDVEQLLQDKEERAISFKVVYASYDWTVNDRSL